MKGQPHSEALLRSGGHGHTYYCQWSRPGGQGQWDWCRVTCRRRQNTECYTLADTQGDMHSRTHQSLQEVTLQSDICYLNWPQVEKNMHKSSNIFICTFIFLTDVYLNAKHSTLNAWSRERLLTPRLLNAARVLCRKAKLAKQ